MEMSVQGIGSKGSGIMKAASLFEVGLAKSCAISCDKNRRSSEADCEAPPLLQITVVMLEFGIACCKGVLWLVEFDR